MIMKEEKGITLIALVITIVVLLILAAVTINLTLGERGIFNTAQLAAKNYTDAAEKEAIDLDNFENEVDKIVRDTTEAWEDITVANYGDYVNYEDGLELGSSTYGHETDWRVFYKDKDGYVYLISSYLLPYSQVPSETNLQGYDGRPYTAYWPTLPNSYTDVPQSTYDRYMMNFKYNGSPNNTYSNMKCVSELMDTTKWSKFVNTKYAEDAIGAPTLEMWVESWNAKGNIKLYHNTNSNGYYIGTSSVPTATWINISSSSDYSNTLYFPVTSRTYSDVNGKHYRLASPSANGPADLMCVLYNGTVNNAIYHDNSFSVRPIVRLKNTVNAEKVNGIWELK